MADRPLRGLYAITDPGLLPGRELVAGVEAALRGGAAMVQYRDKSADLETRRRRAQALLALCRDWHRPLIINDDLALAVSIGADGIHLGQEDASPGAARKALGPDAIIGVTCHHSLQLARDACQAGANYLAFGRFFSSATKQQAPPAPLSILTEAHALGLPRVAIGGINLNNAHKPLEAGAEMLAVVHGLFSASDIENRAAQFVKLIENGN